MTHTKIWIFRIQQPIPQLVVAKAAMVPKWILLHPVDVRQVPAVPSACAPAQALVWLGGPKQVFRSGRIDLHWFHYSFPHFPQNVFLHFQHPVMPHPHIPINLSTAWCLPIAGLVPVAGLVQAQCRLYHINPVVNVAGMPYVMFVTLHASTELMHIEYDQIVRYFCSTSTVQKYWSYSGILKYIRNSIALA